MKDMPKYSFSDGLKKLYGPYLPLLPESAMCCFIDAFQHDCICFIDKYHCVQILSADYSKYKELYCGKDFEDCKNYITRNADKLFREHANYTN